MREALFIKQNKDKWQKIDEAATLRNISAKELADNYIELTDDLSYARTFYPKSNTERYLNQLANKYFTQIYSHKKKEKGRFKRFWVTDLPLIMYQYRKMMLLSFIIFAVSMFLGAFSMSVDSSFAEAVMGKDYVNMTQHNINKNDPMAVYKDADSGLMFGYITTNNIKVAFMAFIFGIFFSVGSAYIMFSNGVMLGTFMYFFYQKGLLGVALPAVWLHGTLEISAIIIAGGAGMVLGNSFLFPGTYSRAVSMKKGALDSVKIVVGLVPVFVVAGFIESYLTRLTEMPLAFNLTIIGLSALFIILYFIYYPYKLNKRINATTN
ncbi:putative membrane protein SpoIIM required for sporulation [Dysgonomonas sp. PH5-45]|uniref:stage II sporulation protein M n=1 Tax=unclassified Dysgonomonas TaxID=2630389 RepID=UPI0024756DA3|nr:MULTISPECIES: stage II sporulation protein M [unclassified Dysgonomonas]MDH6354018.1 putative membrane protein SpoIIM required for sporulation [Dysgonomonas sp. PH5-45]MDH6386920.1 putative membrane protein SpoIIM required for sporulation [Dysgonomonas sp. PH5-37]